MAVWVGQIDPPQIGWLDLRPERLKEIRPGTGQSVVDEQRLLGSNEVGEPGIGSTSVRATTSSAGFAT